MCLPFFSLGARGGKKKSRKGRFPGQFTEHPEMNIHLNTNDEYLSANLSSHSQNGSNNKICRWTPHRATLLFWNTHYALSLRYIKGPKKWPELYYDPTGSCDRKSNQFSLWAINTGVLFRCGLQSPTLLRRHRFWTWYSFNLKTWVPQWRTCLSRIFYHKSTAVNHVSRSVSSSPFWHPE